MNRVFIGYERRYPDSYAVTMRSLLRRSSIPLVTRPLFLPSLIADGLYTRETVFDEIIFDKISGAPCSTEFAISRFLIPHLANYEGWALFCDNDFLFLADVAELFALADNTKAIMCVKHNYNPTETVKMEGQPQTTYPRKNWSSLMLINCEHPANKNLDIELVNQVPGRDLHGFCWLPDELIGELPESWNWLEGHSSPDIKPKAVHFTRGVPSMKGFQNVLYSEQWFEELKGIEQCESGNSTSLSLCKA